MLFNEKSGNTALDTILIDKAEKNVVGYVVSYPYLNHRDHSSSKGVGEIDFLKHKYVERKKIFKALGNQRELNEWEKIALEWMVSQEIPSRFMWDKEHINLFNGLIP